MVREQAISELAQSAPDTQVSLIIRWLSRPTLPGDLRSMPFDRRREAIVNAFASIKCELLTQLKSQPGVEINDLRGSADVIITGPASTLTSLVSAAGPLGSRSDVHVLANTTLHFM
jgi:hypothetical protein